jgi:hypothetical protein
MLSLCKKLGIWLYASRQGGLTKIVWIPDIRYYRYEKVEDTSALSWD